MSQKNNNDSIGLITDLPNINDNINHNFNYNNFRKEILKN